MDYSSPTCVGLFFTCLCWIKPHRPSSKFILHASAFHLFLVCHQRLIFAPPVVVCIFRTRWNGTIRPNMDRANTRRALLSQDASITRHEQSIQIADQNLAALARSVYTFIERLNQSSASHPSSTTRRRTQQFHLSGHAGAVESGGTCGFSSTTHHATAWGNGSGSLRKTNHFKWRAGS